MANVPLLADCKCGWKGFLAHAQVAKKKGRATEFIFLCPDCHKDGVVLRYPEKKEEDEYVI